ITRVLLYFGFMEHPNIMEGLKLACRAPALRLIDPERITFYSRRIMVVPRGAVPGMSVWHERIFATMHLNANLPLLRAGRMEHAHARQKNPAGSPAVSENMHRR